MPIRLSTAGFNPPGDARHGRPGLLNRVLSFFMNRLSSWHMRHLHAVGKDLHPLISLAGIPRNIVITAIGPVRIDFIKRWETIRFEIKRSDIVDRFRIEKIAMRFIKIGEVVEISKGKRIYHVK